MMDLCGEDATTSNQMIRLAAGLSSILSVFLFCFVFFLRGFIGKANRFYL